MHGLKNITITFTTSFVFVILFHLVAHYILKFEQLSIFKLLLASVIVTGVRLISKDKQKS